jgi:catechol 2,3-dioxygenase-like lactoylglutathione lyase family enzyme
MTRIGKQWHVNHIVDDYRRVSDWYREVFGAADIFVDEWLDAEKRWASMVAIADLAIDVMQPTPEGADLPLGKFLTRFGPHFHAAAYFVDSTPLEIFDVLTAQGVRCFGLAGAGRDTLTDKPMSPVFTHPRDTAGQLEFMPFVDTKPGPLGVPGRWEDPRFLDGWSVDPWRRHPLAIVGWRVGVVVRDLDRAIDIYRALGADVVAKEETSTAQRCRLHLGTNTTVELIKPSTEDSAAGRDLAANGEIMHSCIFETSDLASAEAHLAEHGVVVAERDDDRWVTDPTTCHGAVFEFVAADTHG